MAEVTKIQANCPCCVCGATDSDIAFETEYPAHNYPGVFSVRKCRVCGLLFNSPRLGEEDIGRLYQEGYYFFRRDDASEFERITEVYRRTVMLVDGDIRDRSVLEIGSAKGYLLAVMNKMGWKVKGIEISAAAAAYARKTLGVDTYTGTVAQYVQTRDCTRYPLVLAIDLVEHVLCPLDFVRQVHQVTEDEGVVIIDTPNGGSDNVARLGVSWKGFNPFHIFLFSKDNIVRLLSENGFAVERVFSYGNQAGDVQAENVQGRKTCGFKDAVKWVLKRLGLFGLCMSVVEMLRKRQGKVKREKYVRRTVDVIRAARPYFETADSTGPLAKDCRGDNLVVIARKKGVG